MAKKKEAEVKEKIDDRYPFTYACDYIRMVAGHNREGTKLSRSDASQIRQTFAKVTGIDDNTLATMLADDYLKNRTSLESEAYKNFLAVWER